MTKLARPAEPRQITLRVDDALLRLVQDGYLGPVELVLNGAVVATLDVTTEMKRIVEERRRSSLADSGHEVQRVTVDAPPHLRPLTLPHDAVDEAIKSLAEDGHLGSVEIVVDGAVVATLDVATELARIARKPPVDEDDDDGDEED